MSFIGGKRDHLETTGGANPFLIYQTESFLRQRILQELKLIAGLHHTREEQEGQEVFSRKMSEAVVQLENQHDQLFSLSKRIAERFRMKKSISFDDMVDTSTDPPQAQEQQQKVNIPAALLDFSHIGKSSLVPEGRVSSLLPYQTECLEEISLRNLSKHRIPVYSLQRIFQLDSQEEDESKTMSKNGPQDNQGTSWSILERKYPAVFEREAKACQNQLNDFNQTIISLIPSIQSEQNLEGLIVAVPSMSRTMLPLLKSLWRYRMWTGEGWSGDGFGVLEATGRK